MLKKRKIREHTNGFQHKQNYLNQKKVAKFWTPEIFRFILNALLERVPYAEINLEVVIAYF